MGRCRLCFFDARRVASRGLPDLRGFGVYGSTQMIVLCTGCLLSCSFSHSIRQIRGRAVGRDVLASKVDRCYPPTGWREFAIADETTVKRISAFFARIILLGIVALGAALRFYGINFGLPYAYAPDEPSLATMSVPVHILNPPATLTPHWLGLSCILPFT